MIQFLRIGGMGMMLLFSCISPASQETSSTSHAAPSQHSPSSKTVFENVDADTYTRLIEEVDSPVLIDVRTPAEFVQGHIPGAINIDVRSSDFQQQIQELDTSKTYFLNCMGGHRSSTAGTMMNEWGFTHVYNLEGGLRGWKAAGKEVVQD